MTGRPGAGGGNDTIDPMLQHLRHLISSARYNRGGVLRPGRLAQLARAWARNELAYVQRTRRLGRVLDADPEELRRLFAEAADVMEYCRTELRRYSLVLPGLLNPNYGPVLYAAVRVLRPDVIVETGVGSGVSSTFFLSALEANRQGRLYSVDLPLPDEHLLPDGLETGWLAKDRLRDRWELRLGDARRELPAVLDSLGRIDCFYHDSDHSYEHMTWEFQQAYPHVRPGGLVLSDDVTSNEAWDEFASRVPGRNATINRTGVLRKPA